jgi:hypothetical protein
LTILSNFVDDLTPSLALTLLSHTTQVKVLVLSVLCTQIVFQTEDSRRGLASVLRRLRCVEWRLERTAVSLDSTIDSEEEIWSIGRFGRDVDAFALSSSCDNRK